LRHENLAHLDHVIEDAVAGVDDPSQGKAVDREFLSHYYREHLRFSFGEKEKEGLRGFADVCERRSLLPKRDLGFRVV
jgi:predicted solute-binding protein